MYEIKGLHVQIIKRTFFKLDHAVYTRGLHSNVIKWKHAHTRGSLPICYALEIYVRLAFKKLSTF